MSEPRSDALVFFGASGDLAYKKIFPALQRLVKRGRLSVPVLGVARSGWTRDQLVERARESVAENGGADPEAFPKLAALLRYVDGETAILTGDAPNRATQELIEEVAKSVPGIKKVDNRVKLTPEAAAALEGT